MQRKVLLAALAVLALIYGCAKNDPNLAVHPLSTYAGPAKGYTLNLKTYGLDADGRARLVANGDASLAGFVTRTLAAKGYHAQPSGPAGFGLEIHLLCGNMRKAKLGFVNEAVALPASAVPGYREQVHFWLPENMDAPDQSQLQRDKTYRDQAANGNWFGGNVQQSQSAPDGTAAGAPDPESCQGRVLVVLNPAPGKGPVRQVYVARSATEDCGHVKGCPVDACRNALEQALVELLEKRM